MQSLFEKNFKRMETEVEALKAARIKAAQTLTVKSWTSNASITISNWMPTKTIKITMTPTSTSSPNILASVCGTNADHVFRILRTMSGNNTVFYLTWVGHLDYNNDRQNETINTTISIRYTAPASFNLTYVEPIYG